MTGVDYRDHRRAAAMETNQAKGRGWDLFVGIVDTAPWYVRALELMFRPSTLVSLSLFAGSVWLLVSF